MKFSLGLFRKSAGTLIFPVLILFVLPLIGLAQRIDNSAQGSDETTVTGVVSSSPPATLVLRGEDGKYQLFIFDRSSRRPRTIATGSHDFGARMWPSSVPTVAH